MEWIIIIAILCVFGCEAQDKEWTRLSGTQAIDDGRSLAIDSLGNIYVTGYTEGALDGEANMGGEDIFLTKYDRNGAKFWTKLSGTPADDRGHSVIVDSWGNIYVTGSTGGALDGEFFLGGSFDIFLMKYDGNGTKIWTRLSGTGGTDQSFGLAVDSLGNIYVTGYTSGDGADIILLKYGSDGTKIWTGHSRNDNDDYGYSVAVDTADNIYISGLINGMYAEYGSEDGFYGDVYVMKYDKNGTRVWTSLLGIRGLYTLTFVSDINPYPYSMTIDKLGQIYVAGVTDPFIYTPPNTGNMFLVKCDSSGKELWSKFIYGDFFYESNGVALDSWGNPYVIGRSYYLDRIDSVLLTKYNGVNGDVEWTRNSGTSSSSSGSDLVVDSAGNIYMTGYTGDMLDGQSNAGSLDVFLMKYDSNGASQYTPGGGISWSILSVPVLIFACIALLSFVLWSAAQYDLSSVGVPDPVVSCVMWPHKRWLSFSERKRLFLAAAGVMTMQLFDLTSDLILLSGIVGSTSNTPCRFCASIYSISAPSDVVIFDTFKEWLRSDAHFYFEHSCMMAETMPYADQCMEEFGFLCECNLSNDTDYIMRELDAFHVFALAVLICIVLKEVLKMVIIALFFLYPRFHTTAWFKYALNSPFLLLSLWAPAVRELLTDTMEAELENKEQAFHILMDLLIEDIPQLVIPIWYFIRGTPSYIAVVSFLLSCVSILITVYRVVKGIQWKKNAVYAKKKASSFISRVKANAGLEIRPKNTESDKTVMLEGTPASSEDIEDLIVKVVRQQINVLVRDELAAVKLEMSVELKTKIDAELTAMRSELDALRNAKSL